MLFLGKITDLIKVLSQNSYPNPDNRIDTVLPANVGLSSSNTLFISNCDDITYLQLNQGTFDEVYCEVYNKKSDINNYIFPENWNKYSVLHATFNNNNLAAGNFDYTVSEVNSLVIKRRLYNSVEAYLPIFEKNIYTNTNEFNFIFNDYLVRNHKEYEYILVPILKTGIEGNVIHAVYEDDIRLIDFEAVFICEPDSVYSTLFNVELTEQKNKPSFIISSLGAKYPYVVDNTENNYYTGTVKGLFVQYKNKDYEFENSWDYRKKFNDFLLDGKVKVLKYYDGRIWLVKIYDNVSNERDGHDEIIITSFSWAEAGDVNDVYKLYDNGFISYNPYTKSLSIPDEYDYSSVIYTANVTDNNNRPISSAEVKLYDNIGNIINATNTNENGQFSFSKLKDGDYSISITKSGYISGTITLSIDNHRPIAVNNIVMNKIESNSQETNNDRMYYTQWKTLVSSSNDNFNVNEIYTNENMPSCVKNTGKVDCYVELESDFIVRRGDIVNISITGTYENIGSDDDLYSAGFPHCGIEAYTGAKIDNPAYNTYNEVISASVRVVLTDTIKKFTSSANSIVSVSGYLKLKLFAERCEIKSNSVYSVIDSVAVYVNGKNIFQI